MAEPVDDALEPTTASRGVYVEAVLAEVSNAQGLDAVCVAEGLVDSVGVAALNGAGVMPAALADLDSLADLGIEVDAEQRAALSAMVERCFTLDAAVEEGIALMRDEMPPLVATCLVDGVTSLVADRIVVSLIEGGSPEFPEPHEAIQVGISCAQGTKPLEGFDLMVDDGSEPFLRALIAHFLPPDTSTSDVALLSGEAECFAREAIDVIGEDELRESGSTVWDVASYLRGLMAPADRPFALSLEQVDSLAEAYVSCVDVRRVDIAALLLGLTQSGIDTEDRFAVAICSHNAWPDATVLELQAVYEHGSEAYDDFFFQQLILSRGNATARCVATVDAGPAGEWYRNDPQNAELLTCVKTENAMRCDYSVPADAQRGWVGSDIVGELDAVFITADDCPPHMTESCDRAVFIAQGTMRFSTGIETVETLAVQPQGGLVLSWDTPPDHVDVFHCPWYRTFELAEARAAECDFGA